MSGRTIQSSDSNAAPTSFKPVAPEDLQAHIEMLAAESSELRRAVLLRDRMLDLTSKGCVVIDARGAKPSTIFVNRALARLTGYTASELIGLPAEMIVEGAAAAKVATLKIGNRALLRGVMFESICDTQGRVTHHIGVVADAAAQMAAERAREELQNRLDVETRERQRVELELHLAQKLEAVGRLAAGVAHEINTPIQYVGDSVHFLRSAAADLEKTLQSYRDGLARIADGSAPQEVAAQLAEIERANDIVFHAAEMPKAFARTLEGVERVAQIVRAMKEFSHPDVDEQNPADINHALETTLIVTKNEYKYAAEVTTNFEELPPVVCNIGELNQVFLNMIVNAAHAIMDGGRPAGAGKISVATRAKGEVVEIEFADNGCGIPAGNLSKIFDPFFTTKEVGRGTGQGLAITRSIIVEKHRGSVQVESVVGQGTKFTFQLPVAGRPRVEALA
jgi:signal transduction histidine kinase